MAVALCLLTGQASILLFSNRIFIIAVFIIIFICLLIPRLRRHSIAIVPFVFVLSGFFIAGRLLAFTAFKQQITFFKPDTPYRCDGWLREDPISVANGWRINIALDACGENLSDEISSAHGNVRLYTPELYEKLEAGDRVRFFARLRQPREFKNPGSFNYPRYLLTQGIGAVGSLVGPKWIVKTGERPLTWFTRVTGKARQIIDKAIGDSRESSLSPSPSPATGRGDAAGILKAMIIGRQGEISQETRDAFSHTGLAHLLSISGLHVGYVALIVFFLVRFALGWWPRIALFLPLPRLAAVVSLPAVWFYVAIADFPVSALRAAIMITIFFIALLTQWRRDLLSALATAVFLILIILPASLFSVSFQLSVMSVFAIIILTPVFKECIDGWIAHTNDFFKKIVRPILQIAAVTLAATLGSAPLVALNFHFVSAIGLIANLVAVPFAGIVLMPLAIAASIVSFIHSSAIVWEPAIASANILLHFIKFIDRHGDALVVSWIPSTTEIILAYAVIAIVVFWRRLAYKRLVAGVVGALFIMDFGYWHIKPMINKSLEVTFLDVGHGDSIVMRFPNGKVALIDGGGVKGSDFDIGRHVVIPALLRMGIHHVDKLILTHPHHDHYKGLATVAEQMRPNFIYTNGGDAPEEEWDDWQDFLNRVQKKRVPIVSLAGPDNQTRPFVMEEGGAKLKIFAPSARDVSILDPNDASLVTRLSYGERSFLLTGDLMQVGERLWLDAHLGVSSDILKIGHHGSETSTSDGFLKAVKPAIAVITVGEHNQYGVPDQIVLDRLSSVGARIYRTDRDGAITVRTNGNSLDVETFVKNPKH